MTTDATMARIPVLVPGASAAGRVEVAAPYDGAVLATVDQVDGDGVERALATAHALHRDRDTWLPIERRVEILEGAVRLMREQQEQLAVEAAREGGKPLVDSRVEVARAIDSTKECVEHIRTQHGREVPMGINAASSNRIAFTHHEPIGVVVAFSAFNHPLNLIAHQVGPAVATGCPVIIKPAENTPLSAFRYVRILREAGLPEGWCQPLLTTGHDVSGDLATDPRVAFFSFIGSARVGWMLRAKLAPGTRLALEHGGAAPVIVAADADLDDALPLLVKGGMYHAGQVCVSVQRVFAHRSVARDLADRMAEAAGALKVGNPTKAETDVGPLISPREVGRVDAWVQAAAEGGAEVLCGGEALSETTYAPTVLFDPPADAEVSTQEIFGPVICVYPYDDVEDALARANALPYSFQAAVFTSALDTAWRVARRIDASAVMVNDHTAFRVDWMPFAGLRTSGFGIGGIPYTMHDMQVEKLVVFRSKEL